MELKHLRAFAAVAEHHSFTRAAHDMALTQAAISQQVAALERELGVRLFDRRTRNVQLTEPGRRFHRYAGEILDLLERARREVSAAEEPLRGTLRIAASTVPAEWFLPPRLAAFRAQFPQVRESLSVSDSRGACRAVVAGDADVGFVGELPRGSRLRARAVARDELKLVVTKDHPWAGRRSISPEQLCGQPLLVREADSGSRRCVERCLRERGIQWRDLNIAMEANSNEAIRAAMQQGVGAAFLSEKSLAADEHADRYSALRVRGMRFQRQLYLVTRREKLLASPLREFVDFMERRQQQNAPGANKKTKRLP